ncbi:MAG: N5,N10-methylene tetrahydromethanopterin reductase, partial [Comamonas sp.]
GVDGFNLARTVVPECFGDFIDLVVPELQSRGLHKSAYAPGSMRHKLFGQGDRLPDHHHARQFRQQPSVGSASVTASPSLSTPRAQALA